MRAPLIKDILSRSPDNSDITVRGWVRTKRDTKNIVFIELNDGSCFANLQLTLDGTASIT